MNAYNAQRLSAGTVALGIAQRAFEEARNFALNRNQFGRPIAKFQGLQCLLADMSISLKALRASLHDAVHAAGDGFPDICVTAQAKVFASETAIKVTQYALKIHLLMASIIHLILLLPPFDLIIPF